MSEGIIFVISGPSGSGKTSVVKRVLQEEKGLVFSVSHTTRPPRPGEVDGRDYYFISEEQFKEMVEKGEFIEWACVYGRYYGTSRRELEQKRKGHDVLLDIDVQGAESIKKLFPDSVRIFLLPPSFQELERRLRQRGDTSEEEIKRRLKIAKQEIARHHLFNYIVVNDDLQRCVQSVLCIIRAERLRRERMEDKVKEVLEGA